MQSAFPRPGSDVGVGVDATAASPTRWAGGHGRYVCLLAGGSGGGGGGSPQLLTGPGASCVARSRLAPSSPRGRRRQSGKHRRPARPLAHRPALCLGHHHAARRPPSPPPTRPALQRAAVPKHNSARKYRTDPSHRVAPALKIAVRATSVPYTFLHLRFSPPLHPHPLILRLCIRLRLFSASASASSVHSWRIS